MKTLYEILGVRPDDDAEAFKRAFRRAVKTSHPDFHADDPDAPIRFRQVVEAYTILRDPETRADYDQLLELEREQLRATPRRYPMRKFVFDGIAAASLAVVMAVGYALFADILPSVSTAKVDTAPWRGPAKITAVQPAAPTDTTDHDAPRDKLPAVEVLYTPAAPREVAAERSLAPAANSGNALGNPDSGPASSAASRIRRIAAPPTLSTPSAPRSTSSTCQHPPSPRRSRRASRQNGPPFTAPVSGLH